MIRFIALLLFDKLYNCAFHKTILPLVKELSVATIEPGSRAATIDRDRRAGDIASLLAAQKGD